MPNSLADVFARLVLDDSQAKKDLANLGNDPAATTGGQKVGQKFGAGLSKGFIAAGASSGFLLAGAVESAGSFEQQLATIKTVATDLSDVQLAKIGDDIQALSRETGKSTDDLTAGFYDLVSAGVPAEDAISVLKDSAVLATGALGTTGDTVDLVTSALNSYGLSADQSGKVTDIFAKAVADGKVTAGELGQSLARVAPIASSAGISLEEVSAGYATLTANGVPAAEASTLMKSAIASLIKPNAELNKIQKATGINFAKLAKEKGLAVALEELRKATGGSQEAMVAALGSTEAYGFAVQVTGDKFAPFIDQIEETGNASGLAAQQYDIAMSTTEAQAKRFGASVATAFQDIGDTVLPVAGPLLLTLNQLGPALGGLVSPAKLVGGALGSLAGAIVSGIPAIAGTLATAGSTIGGIIAAAIPVGMALLPALLVAAIIAAIVFLANNPEIVDEIIAFAEGLVQWIVDTFGMLIDQLPAIISTAINAMAGIFQQLPGLIGDLLPKIAGLFLRIGTRIGQLGLDMVSAYVRFMLSIPLKIAGLLPQVGGLFLRIAGRVVQLVTDMVAKVVAFILSIPGKIPALVSGTMAVVGNLVRGFITRITGLVGDVVRSVISIPGKFAQTLINGFRNAAQKAAKAFLDALAGLPGAAADIVGGAVGGVGNFVGGLVPKFQEGAEYTHEGLAYLHEGEMVIPPAEAAMIRKYRGADAVPSMAPGGYAEGGLTVNVPVDGALPVRTLEDMVNGLRGIAEAGVLPSLLESPKYRRREVAQPG